jgi:hypothetical protein
VVLTRTHRAEQVTAFPAVAAVGRARETSRAGSIRWVLAATVFIGSFVFRFLGTDFANDHFYWISGGRQILVYGEIPLRDFPDPGYFLQHFASAAVQLIFGYSLFGEALLSISFISLGHMLTFLLATRASNSPVIGLVVTILAIATYPRLYNYPKVFLYVFGLLLCWRYVDTRSFFRLAILAIYTAVAALFRHDHGIYIGAAAAATVIATHWPDGFRALLRRVGLYAALLAAPLVPFLVFVAVNGGVATYLGRAAQFTEHQQQASMRRIPPGLAIDTRTALGVFNEENAATWLYWLFVVLPLAVLALLALKWLRGRSISRTEPLAAPKVVAAGVLCALATPPLLREPLQARFGDVSAPAAVLGAWLLGWFLRGQLGSIRTVVGQLRCQPGPANTARLARAAVPPATRFLIALALLGLTWASISSVSEASQWSAWRALHAGHRALGVHATRLFQDLQASPPPTKLWPSSNVELRDLARYVSECTRPTDKALVLTRFAPEFHFYSGRGFLRGRSIRQEPVPIIIWDVARYDASRVDPFIPDRYEPVRESRRFGSTSRWQVLVDKQRTPSGTYQPLSLPCYAGPSA